MTLPRPTALRSIVGLCAALVALSAAPSALAFPAAGSKLPAFHGSTLGGEAFDSAARLTGKPALVVAITDRGAARTLSAWFKRATGTVPREVTRLSVISLELPFFVPISLIRSTAQGKVPARYWKDVLLDKGDIGEALGLANVAKPVAMAVGADGKVLAVFTGGPEEPGAEVIWKALGASPPAAGASAPATPGDATASAPR